MRGSDLKLFGRRLNAIAVGNGSGEYANPGGQP